MFLGQVGLMHTSSEPEPRNEAVEKQYTNFIEYSRRGRSAAYAESWADSVGRHGSVRDHRVLSPAQWIYWRLLADLHAGVSFIAVYGSDLRKAKPSNVKSDSQKGGERREFEDALLFASDYAGYHASPEMAPGAWIAFRHGDVTVETNQPLRTVNGDYSFLMGRIRDDNEVVTNVGPRSRRFGAWALMLTSASRVRLKVDELFLKSVAREEVTVGVIYSSSTGGFLKIGPELNPRLLPLQRGEGGEWALVKLTLRGRELVDESEGTISIGADQQVFLHMVEIRRKRPASVALGR